MISFDGSEFVAFDMPGSTPAVAMQRLEAGEGWSRSVVEFPPGFSRPGAGWYAADEEFFLLSGDLVVSGISYGPGDYAYLPAGYVRSATSSQDGALAIAWFSAPPAWTDSDGPGSTYDESRVIRVAWPSAPVVETAYGPAHVLRVAERVSWMFPAPPVGRATHELRLISLADRIAAKLDSGEELPHMSAPVFATT